MRSMALEKWNNICFSKYSYSYIVDQDLLGRTFKQNIHLLLFSVISFITLAPFRLGISQGFSEENCLPDQLLSSLLYSITDIIVLPTLALLSLAKMISNITNTVSHNLESE